MRSLAAIRLFCLAGLLAPLQGAPAAAPLSPAPASPAASAPATPARSGFSAGSIEAKAPIKKFTLPLFTSAGVRTMHLRGDEARLISEEQIDVTGMLLSLYDEKDPRRIDTTFTAASAHFFTKTQTANGDNGVNIHRDDVEMWGTRWNYIHKFTATGKKVVIEGRVKVIFQSQLGDILK